MQCPTLAHLSAEWPLSTERECQYDRISSVKSTADTYQSIKQTMEGKELTLQAPPAQQSCAPAEGVTKVP